MKHHNLLFKRLSFLVAFMAVIGNAWGGNHYAKMTVQVSSNSTGLGKVWANPGSTSNNPQYQDDSFTTNASSEDSDNKDQNYVDFYLYSQANPGNVFIGWSSTNGSKTVDANSNVNPFMTTVAKHEDRGQTASYTRYAVFEKYPTATVNVGLTNSSTGGGTVAVSASASNPGTYGATAQLSQYFEDKTGGPKTFYLFAQPNTSDHYVFAAWATDPDATNGVGSATGYEVTHATGTDYGADVVCNYYAIFRKLPYFRFKPVAVAQPADAGTVTATPDKAEIWAADLTQTQATTKATFQATPIDTYYFAGWTATSGKMTPDENMYANPYTEDMTNSVGNSEVTLTRYGIFVMRENPTSISVTSQSEQIDKGGSFTLSYSLTPDNERTTYKDVRFTSANPAIATVDPKTGVVTGVAVGTTTITLTAYKVDKTTPACSTTVSVKVMDKLPAPLISLTPSAEDNFDKALVAITAGADSPSQTIFRYTIDGTTPDEGSQQYTVPFKIENQQTVKAVAYCPDWYPSDVAEQTYSKQITSTPSVEISLSGSDYVVSFTCKDDDVVFYYTTDDTTPAYDSSTGTPTGSTIRWNGTPFTPGSPECVINVIATHEGWRDSEMASRAYIRTSGVADGVVYLNDYEDHNWTYYAGVDPQVDGGNYNTNYAGILYKPDPRNVKVTYQGNGGAVSIDEPETVFVYYNTLEKQNDKWLYTTIANPFSKRPVVGTGDSRWRGFGSWEVVSISGGSVKSSDGATTYAVGSQIPAETEIQFVPSGTYTPNCTSMEIVLKVNWVQAYRYTNASSNMVGSSYETNFLVLTSGSESNVSKNCTVMMVEPDGSADYRTNSFSGSITVPDNGTTKIEFAQWTTNRTIDAAGRNLYIGRGVTTTRSPGVRGHDSSDNDKNQLMKIGSGTYSTFYAISNYGDNVENQHIVFGTDYDRAKADNSKLTFTGQWHLLGTNIGNTYRKVSWIESKSGRFTNTGESARSSGYTFYMWYNSGSGRGYRKLEIQGGEFWHICGGADQSNDTGKITLDYRIKGGIFHGGVFMGAASYPTNGDRCMVITGGKFEGWIAGGSDAISSDNNEGVVKGKSYIYVGGNAVVDSNNSNTPIDASLGGNVYGCGIGAKGSTGTQGTVTDGTNVIVADNSYVERGVYGGGSYGYTNAGSNLYVTGGHVAGKSGGVDGTRYDASVTGGVFGGACKNRGAAINIYTTGGVIEGGLYGGCNVSGNVSSVNMILAGGQIGSLSSLASKACGGGYGTSTGVTGNVNMTIGVANTSTSPFFYGNCYGGSALGSVTGNVALTINKGAAYCDGESGGEVFCGGLGQSGSTTYGNVGGTLTTVINGTDERPGDGMYAFNAVYGGTHYINQNKTPAVTVNGCEVSIKELYGGSKQATLSGTNITVNGGNTIGSLYGGSNMANINGNVNLSVYGGGIDRVFGGNNNSGSISGTINMTIDQNSECDMYLGEVYGGGNRADSRSVAINIGCPGYIGQLYGGANEANITGDIVLGVHGGKYGAIYGGNNKSGTISGSVTVNVEKQDCDLEVDTIFGGGNLADLSQTANTVTVNVRGADTKVGSIYGGGNLAAVYSSVVNVFDGHVSGNVFGGGKGETGSTKNMILNGGTNVNIYGGTLNNVFGGNDAGGTITGTLQTTINKGDQPLDITGEVYGGGNEAASASGQLDIICVDHIGSVYGGARNADVTGNINLKIGSGSIDNVFGGNNIGGSISGAIAIDVQHNGCSPVAIGNLYGAGNLADYTAPAGTQYSPLINLKTCGESPVDWRNEGTHCMKVGTIFGGGKGQEGDDKGKVTGNPQVNVYAGEIGTIYGGGNAADVEGDTYVNVIDQSTSDQQDIYVTGNVYGGGNQAHVTGDTHVQIGPKQ